MKRPITHSDYCQYLLVSQTNYTLTNFAEHSDHLSHDSINRHLRSIEITGRSIWRNAKKHVITSDQGYIVFDDTVLDKRHSFKIELVRRQYSGNAKGVIKGIGVVTCVYVNPTIDRFWLIDYRIYDPDRDGKSKLDHVHDMLANVVEHKKLPFHAVLMDSWYAAKDLLLFIESMGKIYYCPLKSNRQVDDSNGEFPYKRVDSLDWNAHELDHGKQIKIKSFPKDHKVRLFRVETSTSRTDWVITNDPTQISTQSTREVCAFRWKIEQLHREGKQVTGLESCQCRKARIQRNHIGAAFLVWGFLKTLAAENGRTLYQLKHGLLDDYLSSQLRNPSIKFSCA